MHDTPVRGFGTRIHWRKLLSRRAYTYTYQIIFLSRFCFMLCSTAFTVLKEEASDTAPRMCLYIEQEIIFMTWLLFRGKGVRPPELVRNTI